MLRPREEAGAAGGPGPPSARQRLRAGRGGRGRSDLRPPPTLPPTATSPWPRPGCAPTSACPWCHTYLQARGRAVSQALGLTHFNSLPLQLGSPVAQALLALPSRSFPLTPPPAPFGAKPLPLASPLAWFMDALSLLVRPPLAGHFEGGQRFVPIF